MRVSIDGADIHYTVRGTGPVCLVPTAIGTAPYERQVVPALGDHFSLVFVDLRGGGQSTGNAADLTFDQLARDLEAVRRDAGSERVAVLGHSIIGALAVEYGRRCPDTVSHVMLAGAPPRGDMAALSSTLAKSFFEQDASADRRDVMSANLARLAPGASFAEIFLTQAPTRFFDPRVDMRPLFADAVSRPALLGHLVGSLTAAWDIATAGDSLRMPLFIGHGRYDYTVPYVMWDEVIASLPEATWHLFEQSGHQPFFEEPGQFATAVLDWMS